MNKSKPLVLVILDGWGYRQDAPDNAITRAHTANFDELWHTYPHTLLEASGAAVGLPDGQMGNSEVGHLNMGAGRVVYQDITRINRAIGNGQFAQNNEILQAMSHAVHKGSRLHLMGLVSDGGVHSHIDHIYALLALAKQQGVRELYLHAFLDGRDVPPQSAQAYLAAVERFMQQQGLGKIATVSGRYYGMDRDQRWERIEKAYTCITEGAGFHFTSASEAVAASYADGVTDEFILPANIVDQDGQPFGLVKADDSVIFFNFRADRARQITRALIESSFTGFQRPLIPGLHYLCMTRYDAAIDAPVAFLPQNLDDTLGAYLAKLELPQLRIAETEKYAHVTFFFNGGIEAPNKLEDRVLIPSPQVKTYDLQPQMSAEGITQAALTALESGAYTVIIINYANSDMVGHTGILAAAIEANKKVDNCLGRLKAAVLRLNGSLLITADHGNSEQMTDPITGAPHTAHTCSPVPFILADNNYLGHKLRPDGVLADVAPTVLEVLAVPQPEAMTGTSLLL